MSQDSAYLDLLPCSIGSGRGLVGPDLLLQEDVCVVIRFRLHHENRHFVGLSDGNHREVLGRRGKDDGLVILKPGKVQSTQVKPLKSQEHLIAVMSLALV